MSKFFHLIFAVFLMFACCSCRTQRVVEHITSEVATAEQTTVHDSLQVAATTTQQTTSQHTWQADSLALIITADSIVTAQGATIYHPAITLAAATPSATATSSTSAAITSTATQITDTTSTATTSIDITAEATTETAAGCATSYADPFKVELAKFLIILGLLVGALLWVRFKK